MIPCQEYSKKVLLFKEKTSQKRAKSMRNWPTYSLSRAFKQSAFNQRKRKRKEESNEQNIQRA